MLDKLDRGPTGASGLLISSTRAHNLKRLWPTQIYLSYKRVICECTQQLRQQVKECTKWEKVNRLHLGALYQAPFKLLVQVHCGIWKLSKYMETSDTCTASFCYSKETQGGST